MRKDKAHVVYYDDCIEIHDREGKILCWNEDEWKEDSQVVFCIANAIEKIYKGESLP